ncbi:Maf family protein [Parapedobacter indicus]|uniref:dTTP/UTP pyrophosphatase n=1 Tax=Parapedobacter indicus TaxID=1477437 RepID=A0A1I3D1R2_9SPHI|nr:Maf family protein [Parapedobacter indicus]PPL04488.1 septum formation protein [Parapedobacter indicus]SFH80548.1 septum formation protein [Parapedobacter indicus]
MRIILASQSPRRKELLSSMGVSFTVAIREVDESFPQTLNPVAAVRHIAEKKARAFMTESTDTLVITADTIVTIDGQILGKPIDKAHAVEMLTLLSGRRHEVITAVALLQGGAVEIFHETTEVYFKSLSAAEIDYYIHHYQPFDKAGAYGIQEWIGIVAIEKIIGSYTNVVGLPTAKLSEILRGRLDNLS